VSFSGLIVVEEMSKDSDGSVMQGERCHQTKCLATCNFPKVKSSKLCSVSSRYFVLQVMLFSIKEEGGYKVGAYRSRAAELNLGG
jgi:hypothetical protein